MHGDRRLGGWLPSSRRKQAEEREERIRANRKRVVGWALVMENVVRVLPMIRVDVDPCPSENVYLHPAPDASGRIRSYRETPFYYWRIAEASTTTPPLPTIKTLYARWVFARDDTFTLLVVIVESYKLDRQVADALTFAAEAARMAGWRPEEDGRNLHEWLLEGVSADSSAEVMCGQARFGFTRIGFERRHRAGTAFTQLSLEPTAHSLGDRPLDAEGREVLSPNSGDG